ncbi:MAG: hypothetical protein SGPRY_000019 [Prymnesium sp.]
MFELLAESAGRNDYCYGFMDTCGKQHLQLAELAVHNYAHAQSIYSNCMTELVGLPIYLAMQSLLKPLESSAETTEAGAASSTPQSVSSHSEPSEVHSLATRRAKSIGRTPQRKMPAPTTRSIPSQDPTASVIYARRVPRGSAMARKRKSF